MTTVNFEKGAFELLRRDEMLVLAQAVLRQLPKEYDGAIIRVNVIAQPRAEADDLQLLTDYIRSNGNPNPIWVYNCALAHGLDPESIARERAELMP